MKEPPLHTPTNLFGPLDQSNMNGGLTAPFRFADLPAETRNQIYRCILIRRKQPVKFAKYQGGPTLKDLAIVFTNRRTYSEAMPIFLSDNTFSIIGTRTEHAWLRRMRPEGRSELRNVTLVVSEQGCNHDFNLYNVLSLCPKVYLTLKVRPCRLVEASVEGSLRMMHGYVHFGTFTSLLGSIFGIACHLVGAQLRVTCLFSGAHSTCALPRSPFTLAKRYVMLAIQSALSNSALFSRGSNVERRTLTPRSAKIFSSDLGSPTEGD